MKRENWEVSAASGRCTYCRQPVGDQHKKGCVVRRKTVVCKITLEVVRDVPEDWSADDIDFHMNDSSWCADNLIRDLYKLTEREDWCFCRFFEGEYLRGASHQDEGDFGLKVADLSS